MPFLPDESDSSPTIPTPEEQSAPYAQQFLRGLAHSSTFGLWEPFQEAGTGGLPETLGKVAGSAAWFVPMARGVGLGTAAAAKILPSLLQEGVTAGKAAAQMGKLGPQVGKVFSKLGAGATIGATVPLQSELETLGDQYRGVAPPPLSQRLITDSLAAGLATMGGRALARPVASAAGEAASGVAGAVADSFKAGPLTARETLREFDKGIEALKQKLAAGGHGEDVDKLGKQLADMTTRRNTFAKNIPAEPAASIESGIESSSIPPSPAEWQVGTPLGEHAPPDNAAVAGLKKLWNYPPEVPGAAPVSEFAKHLGTPEIPPPWSAAAGESAKPLGEWMKENLSPEHLFGAEYAAPLGATFRLPEPGELQASWLKRSVKELTASGVPMAGIDENALHVGLQLSSQGQRMSSTLGEAVHQIDNPGVASISGGAGSIQAWPGKPLIAPGPSATLRWLRQNVSSALTSIIPIRAMLQDVPGAGHLVDALALATMRMRSSRMSLWDQIPEVARWGKDTEQKVRVLFQKFANRPPEELDAAVRQEVPEAVAGVGQLRTVFDGMWNRLVLNGVLDPEQRVLNYLPLVRERLAAQATGLQLVEKGTGYRPRELENILAGLSPQFAKSRSWGGPEDFAVNVPLKSVLNLYFTQFSRHSVINDMKDEISGLLQMVPNDYKAAIAEHMNFWLGRTAPQMSTLNRWMRDYNFIRAIGANVLSPVKNLMSMINTFAVSHPSDFAQGFADMQDPARRAFFESRGLKNLLSGRSDLDALSEEEPTVDGFIKKVRDVSGRMFMATADTTRQHALMTGLRTAERQGITNPEEQFRFAFSLMNQTQFHVGDQASNLPPLFRSPAGRIVGQFQTFRLNQMHFLSRLVDEARQGAMTGDPRKMVEGMLPFVKFWGPTIAITGSLGVLPGDWGEDTVTRALFGKAMHIPGLAEMLFGVAIPSGMGIGSIEARDLNSFMSYFPGPTVGMIQGLIGASTGVDVGQGLDLSRAGRDLSNEERSRLIVSSLPFGVQTNRVLQMLRLLQTDGNYQRALDFGEFVGAQRPAGDLISEKAQSLEQVLLGVAGYQPAAREQEFRKFHKLAQVEHELQLMQKQAAQFTAAGKLDQAQALVNNFNERWKDYIPAPVGAVPQHAVESAMRARFLPPELRRRLPGALRGVESSLSPPPLIGQGAQ